MRLITARVLESYDWSHSALIEMNFSKLTHNNQSFMNDFICCRYHLSNISAQIIECKIFAPCELYVTLCSVWCYSLHMAAEPALGKATQSLTFSARQIGDLTPIIQEDRCKTTPIIQLDR